MHPIDAYFLLGSGIAFMMWGEQTRIRQAIPITLTLEDTISRYKYDLAARNLRFDVVELHFVLLPQSGRVAPRIDTSSNGCEVFVLQSPGLGGDGRKRC